MPPLDFSPIPEPWHEPSPDPRDRFPWFFAILAAAVICAAFGWRWV